MPDTVPHSDPQFNPTLSSNPFSPLTSAPLPTSEDPKSTPPNFVISVQQPDPPPLPCPNLDSGAVPPPAIPHGPNPSSPHPTPPPPPNPASIPRPPSSIPSQKSYAQAARFVRGPGFIRSHAVDVEPFARIPRTGVNIICSSREGLPSFSFVSSDLPKVEKIYSNALVMKFNDARPSLETSHKEISSWGMEKPFSIGPLSSKAFLLRFQDSKDLLKVLTRPSMLLITCPYKIFRWHNLCHLKEDSCLAPVWISLPRLPLQCFIPEFLESVGNKIGRFLCFDRATMTLARQSAARICVEMDLRKPPPQFIWIGLFDGFKQPVIYERMPKYCNGCHRLGHTSVECSKNCNENPPSHAMEQDPNLQSRSPPVRYNVQSLSRPVSSAVKHSLAPKPPSAPSPDAEGQAHHEQAQAQTVHPPDLGPSSGLPSSLSNPMQVPLSVSTNTVQPSMDACMNHYQSAGNPHALQLTGAQGAQCPNSVVAHSKPPSKSILHKGRNRKKTVTFELPGQSNLSANREFWNAVNTQVVILEHRPSNQSAASIHATQCEGENQRSSNSMFQPLPELSGEESSDFSIAADSPPTSPRGLPTQSQHASYASEGEDCLTEQSPMLGHSTDDLLESRVQNSKRNKRYPDQPLKVQLRVRKDPNSITL